MVGNFNRGACSGCISADESERVRVALGQVIGYDKSFLCGRERRHVLVPRHPYIPVAGDEEVLRAMQLGLAVEHDEHRRAMAAVLSGPVPRPIGNGPGTKGDVHRLGQCSHSSSPITPMA